MSYHCNTKSMLEWFTFHVEKIGKNTLCKKIISFSACDKMIHSRMIRIVNASDQYLRIRSNRLLLTAGDQFHIGYEMYVQFNRMFGIFPFKKVNQFIFDAISYMKESHIECVLVLPARFKLAFFKYKNVAKLLAFFRRISNWWYDRGFPDW